MRTSSWFAGAMLSLLTAAAQAHTHLKAAVPAEGSTVKTSPDNITLTFTGAARLTALTIQKDGDQEHKVTPLPTEAAAQLTVPTPKLAPGPYTVTWRIVSADNHVMSGKLHFTVAEAANKP
jgi:methionine-rich copper-binding protein CopC